MKRAAVLLVITVLLQLAVGADYFWIPNSNWDEPGNWALGRPPCGGEVASFASVSRRSVHTDGLFTTHSCNGMLMQK